MEFTIKIDIPDDVVESVVEKHMAFEEKKSDDEYAAHACVQEWLLSDLYMSHEITDEIIIKLC